MFGWGVLFVVTMLPLCLSILLPLGSYPCPIFRWLGMEWGSQWKLFCQRLSSCTVLNHQLHDWTFGTSLDWSLAQGTDIQVYKYEQYFSVSSACLFGYIWIFLGIFWIHCTFSLLIPSSKIKRWKPTHLLDCFFVQIYLRNVYFIFVYLFQHCGLPFFITSDETS